jgi:hypothetical protein
MCTCCVADPLAGGFDAVGRSGMFAGHRGRGHHHPLLGHGLVQFETQIGECVAQPLAGGQESCGAGKLAADIVGVVVGLGVHIADAMIR